jgi:hypothetical protein
MPVPETEFKTQNGMQRHTRCPDMRKLAMLKRLKDPIQNLFPEFEQKQH